MQRGQGILVKKGRSRRFVISHRITIAGENRKWRSRKPKDVTSKYIKNNKQWKKLVVQRTVSNGDIACIDGRKADLRLYILHCPNGLVYYYPNAIVRIAQEVYSGKDDENRISSPMYPLVGISLKESNGTCFVKPCRQYPNC